MIGANRQWLKNAQGFFFLWAQFSIDHSRKDLEIINDIGCACGPLLLEASEAHNGEYLIVN